MKTIRQFTAKESQAVGTLFRAICRRSDEYEGKLTKRKEYTIKIITPILPMSPLCEFEGDNGLMSSAHLRRFLKVEVQE